MSRNYRSSVNHQRMRRGGGHPSGLKGRDIGLFYAKKQQEKNAVKRDMIEITDEQRKEVEKVSNFLGKNTEKLFGEVDYQSEFMKAYKENLSTNASKDSEKVLDSWEDLEEESEIPKNEVKSKVLPKDNSRLSEFRKKLPAFKMREEILDLVNSNNVVVISGETGCGKTTQIPQYLLESFENPRIVCTQPRRISAITVAERVADERGENLGHSVGYQIRLESVFPRSRNGMILFCTTGIVLQWMIKNPTLSNVTHLIVDEIHERDLQSDFILTLLKDLSVQRPDLKIILMSATLNAQAFSKYFFKCPTLSIPGFTFPVKEFYLEDVLEKTRFDLLSELPRERPKKVWQKHTRKGKAEFNEVLDYEDMIGPFIRNFLEGNYSRRVVETIQNPKCEKLSHNLVASLVYHLHIHEDSGAILVFLPGWDDISKVNTALTSDRSRFCLRNAKIFPLHSLMPTSNQREIFERPPKPFRKIILATNIAETSITIDDVVFVIDCGKVKMTKFDVKANLSTFQPEWISLANARQRKGRAGRVQPGICFHLYTRAREQYLDSYLLPEIQRKRLEEVILQIKILGLGNVSKFLEKVMDPPEPEAIRLSLDLLKSINAIEGIEQLTPLGFHLAQLPMDPQTGKMILLGAIFSCLDPVLSVAASLSFKDAFVVPLGKESLVDKIKCQFAGKTRSDHLMMANVLLKWENEVANGTSRDFCYDNFLSESILRMLDHHKNQFAQHLQKMRFIANADAKDFNANRNSANEALVRAIICAGLYPNVAMLKKIRKNYSNHVVICRTHQENHVEVHPKSVNSKVENFKYQWMVFHLKMKSTKVNLYDASMVSPLSLVFFGQNLNHGLETINGLEIDLVAIDRMIKFNCDRGTYLLTKKLKDALNQLLAFKVSNPGCTNWSQDSKEGALLMAIVKLLTLEVKIICADPIQNE